MNMAILTEPAWRALENITIVAPVAIAIRRPYESAEVVEKVVTLLTKSVSIPGIENGTEEATCVEERIRSSDELGCIFRGIKSHVLVERWLT